MWFLNKLDENITKKMLIGQESIHVMMLKIFTFQNSGGSHTIFNS